MPCKFTELSIQGLLLLEPRRFPDDRGFFVETYKKSEYVAAGITLDFVQDNHSRSTRGVLRGLHFQRSPSMQGKLVRATRGAVWDVAVDLRIGSPTFAKWHGLEMTEDNGLMFYIPPGFAHGFVTLSDVAEFQYKCTAEYAPAVDGGVRWDDPDIGIKWPIQDICVSGKDEKLPWLKDVEALS